MPIKDPTAPTPVTAAYYIAGYLFGDPGKYTGSKVIVIRPADVVAFAQRKPATGKNDLCERFEAAALALGGKTVGWDVKGKLDRVKVTGIQLTIETTITPLMLTNANALQTRAFCAAVIETEGAKDGKCCDDPDTGHAAALSDALGKTEALGLRTWVKVGTGSSAMSSCYVSSNEEIPKFDQYPFIAYGRVPVRTDFPAPYTPPEPVKPTPKPIVVGIAPRTNVPEPPGKGTITHVTMAALTKAGGDWNMTPLVNAIQASKDAGADAITLSIDGGSEESAWAMNTFGKVTLADPQGLRPNHDVVKMWKPEYQARIKTLLAMVADVVEEDPAVREVMHSWNGAEFSVEWTIREAAYKPNRDAWLAGGYNVDQDMANCMGAAQMFADAGFVTTRMTSFQSMFFQHIYTDGTMRQDKAFTRAVMDQYVTVLGESGQVVLGINNCDLASYGPNRPEIYAVHLEYANAGIPRHDQTVTANKMGGAAGCAKFFGVANLTLMTADKVYTVEPPRGSGLKPADWAVAQKVLTDGYNAAHPAVTRNRLLRLPPF